MNPEQDPLQDYIKTNTIIHFFTFFFNKVLIKVSNWKTSEYFENVQCYLKVKKKKLVFFVLKCAIAENQHKIFYQNRNC